MSTVQEDVVSNWEPAHSLVEDAASGAKTTPCLPALAACHGKGMVCSRLSLFSPLFRARAWRCLRLGLAFRMVDIPQSGLLAQTILLR